MQYATQEIQYANHTCTHTLNTEISRFFFTVYILKCDIKTISVQLFDHGNDLNHRAGQPSLQFVKPHHAVMFPE